MSASSDTHITDLTDNTNAVSEILAAFSHTRDEFTDDLRVTVERTFDSSAVVVTGTRDDGDYLGLGHLSPLGPPPTATVRAEFKWDIDGSRTLSRRETVTGEPTTELITRAQKDGMLEQTTLKDGNPPQNHLQPDRVPLLRRLNEIDRRISPFVKKSAPGGV